MVDLAQSITSPIVPFLDLHKLEKRGIKKNKKKERKKEKKAALDDLPRGDQKGPSRNQTSSGTVLKETNGESC